MNKTLMMILSASAIVVFFTVLALPADAELQRHDATVAQLMKKVMSDLPGKEVEMIRVEFAPGAVDPVHRHDAHAFVYVLEGSIVMGLKGKKEVTLKPGDTFYEGPNDIHTVGRNASKTKPAKFLVTLVKNQGAPIVTPVQEAL